MTATELPRFFTVGQSFVSRSIADIAGEVTEKLSAKDARFKPGESVAVAVGSRGIHRIADIAAAVVGHLKSVGARPFVVPAMGSHGGATAEGQVKVLASLGVTPESVGCPIRATMETVNIGVSATGIPIQFDKNASQADHVIVVSRVKPHTRLVGTIQSGLCKMLMIGLGKHSGAAAFHQAFKQFDYRLDRVTGDFIARIIDQMPITLGVAIVEDAFDKTGRIEVLEASQFLSTEPELLKLAEDWMPSLPFERAELLIVDEIGKEISGTGLDTNIVGRKANDRQAADDEWPKIDEIYVRSLTLRTAGNASGIGISEYAHQRVADATDLVKTRINCVTAGHASGAAMPVCFDCDLEVLRAVRGQSALATDKCRWMRIRNTLDLAEVACSEGYWDEASAREDLKVVRDLAMLEFDTAGDLSQ